MVQTAFTTTPEAVLSALLVAGSITIYATNFYRLFETDLFATILLIRGKRGPSCRPWHWRGWSRTTDRKLREAAGVQAATFSVDLQVHAVVAMRRYIFAFC